MKEWFKARNIWGAAILSMSDAEAGRLMKAVWTYTMTGEKQELSGVERVAYALILMTLGQDEQTDAEISMKRAAAGSTGGKQTQANASKRKQVEANTSNCFNKNKNKEEEEEKENITAVAVIKENATTTTDGMPFGLTEADIDASLSQDQRIEDACKTWALPCSAGNIAESRDLIREYGEGWVMQAIQIAGNNKPTWGYVKGVLATAKRNGSMNLPQKRTGKTVSAQQYQQRKYTDAELDNVGDDLLEEARRSRA